MGYPVVHFEVVGGDGDKLRSYYSDLFDWKIDTDNEMGYGLVSREGNTLVDGTGIGGGVMGTDPNGPMADYEGHVTFYVEVPDVEESLAKAESLGGSRVMGPENVMEGLTLGHFRDPEGHLIALVKTGS